MNKMTQAKFYQACETLKKHKQEFLDARPSLVQGGKMLSSLVGFTVGDQSLTAIREATGVHWESRRAKASDKSVRAHKIRTLVNALFKLYKTLGEDPPSSLTQLYDDENRLAGLEAGAVPVIANGVHGRVS